MFLSRFFSLLFLSGPYPQMPYFICFTFTSASRTEGPIFASCFYLDNDERNETFDRRMVPVARRWERGATKPACECLHSHLFRVHKTLLSLPPAIFYFFFLTPSRSMTREMTPKKNTAKGKEREREKCCQGKVANRRGKDRTGTPIHSQTHKRTHIQNQFFSWGRGLILRNCLKTEIRYLCLLF